jgi:CRP/FNR family cyclic AMP-dependent transcriptional regulator
MAQMTGPFTKLDEAALAEFAPHGTARSFPKNTIVVNEGDDTNSLYVVVAGRVKAFTMSDDGREVVFATIGPGEYFGELVLDGGPRTASVMTLEPSRLFVVPASDVEGLLRGNPQFAQDLIRKLIARVRTLSVRVRDLALKDVYGRFVSFLEENAVEMDRERVVPERLTQNDIAARIGGSREMVSRIVRDLSAGGYIAIDAKRIRILKKLPAHW